MVSLWLVLLDIGCEMTGAGGGGVYYVPDISLKVNVLQANRVFLFGSFLCWFCVSGVETVKKLGTK